ncbi:acyltransferase family protein [Compostimonas suwonensis]|nr:acyltransferase family protein [Compostimonas suwonensis]
MGEPPKIFAETLIRRQPFRSDIQGLRAFAVGFVVLYHGGLPFLPGGYVGVDIFFVISGFLITNHLISSLSADGRISFASFYAKRARRILPASFVVLIVSLVLGLLLLPALQREALLKGALATALYVPNLLFAANGTDYLADTTPSLFQHYWSLGVEEQFYLIWPALLVVGFLSAKRSKRSLFWIILVLVIVSFAACVFLTTSSQPWAFFSLPTRAWELGVGGLVAFLIGSNAVKRLQPVAAVGGWIGLGGIIAVGLFFTETTPFPSYTAAFPVLATALVIACGSLENKLGPSRLLGLRPLVFVGTISYSLYLVHWPLLIIPEQMNGQGKELPLWASLGLNFLAVPIAYCLYRWIETPGMKLKPLISHTPRTTLLAVAATSVLIAGISATGLLTFAKAPIDSGTVAAPVGITINPTFTTFVPSNMSPSLVASSSDNPSIYASGCHAESARTQPIGCEFGSSDAPMFVALFGDSHAAQWFPALLQLADEGLIHLRVDTKSSCPSVDVRKEVRGTNYVACDVWRTTVIAELNEERPDLVIMSNFARSDGLSSIDTSEWSDGLARTIDSLDGAKRVAVVQDTPLFVSTPALCLSAHTKDALACASPRSSAIDEAIASAEEQVTIDAGGEYVDLNDYICSSEICGPIIGNTLVYRDYNHLTATFVRSLAPEFQDALIR